MTTMQRDPITLVYYYQSLNLNLIPSKMIIRPTIFHHKLAVIMKSGICKKKKLIKNILIFKYFSCVECKYGYSLSIYYNPEPWN